MKWPVLNEYSISLSVIPGDPKGSPVRLFVRGTDLTGNAEFYSHAGGFVYNKTATKFTLSDCKNWFPQIDKDLRKMVQDVPPNQVFIDEAEFAAIMKQHNDSIVVPRKNGKGRGKKDDAERIDDAGVKIGGARKDFYAKALTFSDLEGMTDVEKTKNVMRDNIWPSISTAEAKDSGIGAEALFAIRIIRRNLNANIKESFNSGDDFDVNAKRYIDSVTSIRDAIFADPLPLSSKDVRMRFTAVLVAMDYLECDLDSRGEWRSLGTTRAWREVDQLFGNDFLHVLFNWYRDVDAPLYKKGSGSWKMRNAQRSDDDYDEQLWEALFPPHFVGTRQKKSDAGEDIDADGTTVEHLAHVEQIGLDWRQGADVTAEQLMGDFGFRAVEFGNWLPQHERQEVMNRAYDAFSTLSTVMGDLDKRMIGFDGALALSFGARGRSGAAAHFEPGREVIHLTRMSGAGSLAHEWGHALDFMIGKNALSTMREHGIDFTQKGRFMATEFLVSKTAKCGRKKWYQPDVDLPHNFKYGECHVNAPVSVQKWSAVCMSMSNVMSRSYIRNPDDTDAERLCREKLNSRSRRLAGMVSDWLVINGCSFKESGAKAVEMVRMATVEGLESLRGLAQSACLPDAAAEAGRIAADIHHRDAKIKESELCGPKHRSFWSEDIPVTRYITAFSENAKKLDEKKSGDYWSSPVEKFARIFETWVFEKLRERGWKDDFLVRANRDEACKDTRFPMGMDRMRLCDLMNDFCMKSSFSFGNKLSNAESQTLADVDSDDAIAIQNISIN